jgi:hypothetical protein
MLYWLPTGAGLGIIFDLELGCGLIVRHRLGLKTGTGLLQAALKLKCQIRRNFHPPNFSIHFLAAMEKYTLMSV